MLSFRPLEGPLSPHGGMHAPALSRFRLLTPQRMSQNAMALDDFLNGGSDPFFPPASFFAPRPVPTHRRDEYFEDMYRRRENEEIQKRRAWERLREERIAKRVREEEEREEAQRQEELRKTALEKEQRKNVEKWWANRRGEVYRIPINSQITKETSSGSPQATTRFDNAVLIKKEQDDEDEELQKALKQIREEEQARGEKKEDPAAIAERLKARLALYGLREIKVTGDGNCQFAAISQCLYGHTARHEQVRRAVVTWLRENENYVVDDRGTTRLKDFLDTDEFSSWRDYCNYMGKAKVWGDHLTLIAAANVYARNVVVISSVATPKDTNGGAVFIEPKVPAEKPAILLSHWHELHYNALVRADD